jgi:hypothetical protein
VVLQGGKALAEASNLIVRQSNVLVNKPEMLQTGSCCRSKQCRVLLTHVLLYRAEEQ